MTKKQFDLLRLAIKAAYPGHPVMPDENSTKLWYAMLGDLEYGPCEVAVKKLIATREFPPKISEIRSMYVQVVGERLPAPGEAWELAAKAVQKYGPYQAEAGMASLPEIVRKAVESIGYMQLCTSDNITADRAHFFRVYGELCSRKAEEKQTPAQIRTAETEIRRIEARKREADKITDHTSENGPRDLSAGSLVTENEAGMPKSDRTKDLEALKRRLYARSE